MESFLDFLFYFPYIPSTFVVSGNAWGITTGCLCVLPPFFTSILFLFLAFFTGLLYKKHVTARAFLLPLFLGSLLWGSSFAIEWITILQALLGASGPLFFERVSIITGLLQLFGAGLVGWAVLFSVRSLHKEVPKTSENHATVQ